MSPEQAAIIVAVITAVGGILGVVIQQFRKENREDHATVTETLRFIGQSVNRVEGKLDRHLENHANDYERLLTASEKRASKTET